MWRNGYRDPHPGHSPRDAATAHPKATARDYFPPFLEARKSSEKVSPPFTRPIPAAALPGAGRMSGRICSEHRTYLVLGSPQMLMGARRIRSTGVPAYHGRTGASAIQNRQSSRRDGLDHLNRRSPSPNSSHAAPWMISSMAISVPSTQRPDQGRVM